MISFFFLFSRFFFLLHMPPWTFDRFCDDHIVFHASRNYVLRGEKSNCFAFIYLSILNHFLLYFACCYYVSVITNLGSFFFPCSSCISNLRNSLGAPEEPVKLFFFFIVHFSDTFWLLSSHYVTCAVYCATFLFVCTLCAFERACIDITPANGEGYKS